MHMEPGMDRPASFLRTVGTPSACSIAMACARPAGLPPATVSSLASEVGTHGYRSEDVIAKGRVGPGQILMVDTHTGELLQNAEIDNRLKARQPYKRWLRKKSPPHRGNLCR